MQKTYLVILYSLSGLMALLVILTAKHPAMVRRKVLLGLLIISMTAPAATIVSCKSGDKKETVQEDVWQTEGWLGGDTFRIMAMGITRKSAETEAQKKAYARESAILIARKMIIERFMGARTESCAGMVDYTEVRISVQSKFGEIIKNGRVIAEKYDADYSCYIIYEVKSPGLKKKVYEYSGY